MLLRIGAFLGLTGVILGAMGAHGALHDLVVENGRLDNWQTAVFYQLVHAVAILALTANATPRFWPVVCWIAGVLIFCGSLYLLALTNVGWLGAITPIGGTFMILGWARLLVAPTPQKAPQA